jgi:hypothetical protein
MPGGIAMAGVVAMLGFAGAMPVDMPPLALSPIRNNSRLLNFKTNSSSKTVLSLGFVNPKTIGRAEPRNFMIQAKYERKFTKKPAQRRDADR